MHELTRVNEINKPAELPPKISQVTEKPIPQELQPYKIKSVTEVGLETGTTSVVCQLDNKHAYNAQSLAAIRDQLDQNRVAVMLDNNFKDKTSASWVKIFKTVNGIKTLVARFDPQSNVLHVDHHLTTAEIGETPLNQELNPELPASTTPLVVAFFRGLSEGTLFTEDENFPGCIESLNNTWDAHQFMVFVDHFDPDSTESSMAVLKASRDNVNHQYFDELAATTLDADHRGTYRTKDGASNAREKLVKVLSELSILSVPRTIKALQVLENITDHNQLAEALIANNMPDAAQLYLNFEKILQSTEAVAESMAAHYDGHGNVVYNVLAGDTELDMAYLASALQEKYGKEIGPDGIEVCLIVKDYGQVDASNFPDVHEYGVWVRTLHEAVDLNKSGALLELLGIYGRSTARGNRNAISHVSQHGVTFTITGTADLLADLNAGSRWRSKNAWGLIKTLEMIFDRDPASHTIEQYIGSRPDSVRRSRTIPGTNQERGVALDTISTGERSGEQRVIKYLIYPPGESPNQEFISEVHTAGVAAALLWRDGRQLVLIPETIGLHIKPGFVGAEFERVQMLNDPKLNEMGMPIVEDGQHQFAQVSEHSEAMLAHLDDMRNVPIAILDAGKVRVASAAEYKSDVTNLLADLPIGLLPLQQIEMIQQLEFHFDQNERVLVNGRTKPDNMFVKVDRIGQTDWQSIKQGHRYEDQVSLLSSFLLMNPAEINRYARGMDFKNPDVQFLFISRALFALQYNIDKIKRLEEENNYSEVEITKLKVLIHLEIVTWALSDQKDLSRLQQLSGELRKKLQEHRPSTAHQANQMFGTSVG